MPTMRGGPERECLGTGQPDEWHQGPRGEHGGCRGEAAHGPTAVCHGGCTPGSS